MKLDGLQLVGLPSRVKNSIAGICLMIFSAMSISFGYLAMFDDTGGYTENLDTKAF